MSIFANEMMLICYTASNNSIYQSVPSKGGTSLRLLREPRFELESLAALQQSSTLLRTILLNAKYRLTIQRPDAREDSIIKYQVTQPIHVDSDAMQKGTCLAKLVFNGIRVSVKITISFARRWLFTLPVVLLPFSQRLQAFNNLRSSYHDLWIFCLGSSIHRSSRHSGIIVTSMLMRRSSCTLLTSTSMHSFLSSLLDNFRRDFALAFYVLLWILVPLIS